jgi:hypothetical protein
MPRRSSRAPAKARSSSAPPFTRVRTKAKAEAKAPSSAPSPLVFPLDVLAIIFPFLGTAEDLGAASRVDKGWKAAADEYWMRQKREEEPWFSMVCARFSTEVMGPIVEVMKEKKDWVKVQQDDDDDDDDDEGEEEDDDDEENFYDEEGDYEGFYGEGLDSYHNASDSESDEDTTSTAAAVLFSMTPKGLWYKSCRAHKTKKWTKTRGESPVPAQFNSPFPGMFLRIELREIAKENGGVGQLLRYRTFPFSDDNLLLELYKEGVSLLDAPDETDYDEIDYENYDWPTQRLTLTLVDLVGGRVKTLMEGNGTIDMNTKCYGFTPLDNSHWGDAEYHNHLLLFDNLSPQRVTLCVFLSYAFDQLDEHHFSGVDDVKTFVQGALKDMFC